MNSDIQFALTQQRRAIEAWRHFIEERDKGDKADKGALEFLYKTAKARTIDAESRVEAIGRSIEKVVHVKAEEEDGS